MKCICFLFCREKKTAVEKNLSENHLKKKKIYINIFKKSKIIHSCIFSKIIYFTCVIPDNMIYNKKCCITLDYRYIFDFFP